MTADFEADILVIGGGTAGSVAAIKAKEAPPAGTVLLLEKANLKRSGAIALGMDGVNNAVVPGQATPEQYVREITVANDGIVITSQWTSEPLLKATVFPFKSAIFWIGESLLTRIPFGCRGRKLVSDVNEAGSSGQSEDRRNFSQVAEIY
jgi:2-polyprenyl-6-methoxyphenol hydroxylase-like FAD-dependent oxidoreductase